MSNGVVLLTGASSGMGAVTAKMLAEDGYTVYGAARRVDRLRELESSGVIPLEMDVTKEDSVRAGVDEVIRREGRIDVLINNAGFGLYGPVEDVPLSDARYQFEVNVFGVAFLTQLVLPHMRKQGGGKIINTSSMGGKIYFPLGAWYHASKHALEGWSDCLRFEAAPFNIQVVIIEPGGVKTEFGDVTGKQLKKYYDKSAYKAQMDPFLKMMGDMDAASAMGSEPEELAKVFVKAVKAKHPKRRYVAGSSARPMMFMRKWFGDGVFEWMLHRTFKEGQTDQKDGDQP